MDRQELRLRALETAVLADPDGMFELAEHIIAWVLQGQPPPLMTPVERSFWHSDSANGGKPGPLYRAGPPTPRDVETHK